MEFPIKCGTVSLGSSLFAKLPVLGFLVFKGLKSHSTIYQSLITISQLYYAVSSTINSLHVGLFFMLLSLSAVFFQT